MITCARRVRPALGIGGCVSRIAVARLQLARDARIRCLRDRLLAAESS
jgi:hypothetical protein